MVDEAWNTAANLFGSSHNDATENDQPTPASIRGRR
jgi:hypothetical protein